MAGVGEDEAWLNWKLSGPLHHKAPSSQGDTQDHQIPLYPIRSGPLYQFLKNPGCSKAVAGIFRIWTSRRASLGYTITPAMNARTISFKTPELHQVQPRCCSAVSHVL